MLFKTTIFSAVAMVMATQEMGAAIEIPAADEVSIMIATDPYYACNCPNNCSHKDGSGCRYYGGPSDSSDVVKGSCARRDGSLTCVAKGEQDSGSFP